MENNTANPFLALTGRYGWVVVMETWNDNFVTIPGTWPVLSEDILDRVQLPATRLAEQTLRERGWP